MKNYIFSLFLALLLFTQCQKSEPTYFSQDALQQQVKTQEGASTPLSAIFKKHRGEIVFVDIWASWCSDCLKSIPEVKKLKKKYGKQVTFLDLSMDKKEEAWLAAIEKHELKGLHFYMGAEWKSKFNQSINLTWIPRFMIVGKDGSIKLFNAEKATDPKIEKTLTKELNTK